MVHSWDTHSIVVKVVDNEKQLELYVDPQLYTPNDRWTRHGDMVHQYARCLKENLLYGQKRNRYNRVISRNISIYIDVWCALNGRFAQRMFDAKVDILKASWSPFTRIPYLIPLLDEALHWRRTLAEIKEDVISWNNHSDVIFLADFPGCHFYLLERIWFKVGAVCRFDYLQLCEICIIGNMCSISLRLGGRPFIT